MELSSFLALLISSHLGGHVSAWAAMCKKHHNLNVFLMDVFTSANSATLSQGKNIIGAHRCQQGLQIAPLGEFLIKMLGLKKEECLDFCKKTFFMSGFVRSILLDPAQAPKEIPLLVELGDSGNVQRLSPICFNFTKFDTPFWPYSNMASQFSVAHYRHTIQTKGCL